MSAHSTTVNPRQSGGDSHHSVDTYPLPHTGKHPQEGDPLPEVIEEKVVEKPEEVITQPCVQDWGYPITSYMNATVHNINTIIDILLEHYKNGVQIVSSGRSGAMISALVLYRIEQLRQEGKPIPLVDVVNVKSTRHLQKEPYKAYVADDYPLFIVDDLFATGETMKNLAESIGKDHIHNVSAVFMVHANLLGVKWLKNLFPNLKYIYY